MQTFLFADLAGYTALTEAHGDERAADVAAEFAAEVRRLLGEHEAEEVKAIGDALLIRVPDARRAACLAQGIVSEQGRRHQALGVRVGLHTGTAVRRGDDWFGSGVNVAARVADVARAGEVLLTGATAQALPSEFGVRARGRRRFKNVADPLELFELTPDENGGPLLTVDPVCRMRLDPDLAAGRRTYRGAEYFFCSERCQAAFSHHPERFTRRRSSREHLRVSDAAREHAVARIGRAFRKGRLDEDELEERTERAYAARTRGELRAVTHDLPVRLRRRRPLVVLPALAVRGVRRLWRRRVRRRLPAHPGGSDGGSPPGHP